jgi:hypothetical protein
MPAFLWKTVKGVPFVLHWWVLPWPWSQLVFDLTATALLALALPALAAGLVIDRAFRWVSFFRTGMINLALITLGKYLLDAFESWSSRPVPGNPHLRTLIIPGVIQILFVFSTFLVSAWLPIAATRG